MSVCALFLILGLIFKGQCLAPWEDSLQYRRLCYNDLQPLYGIRLVDQNVFPYINGALSEANELTGGAIEYPVLTGLFMWFAGIFATDSNSFLVLSALLMAPFGLYTAYLLEELTAKRSYLWAAAPALILYAFHNWDLLVVAASVAGLYQWYRGKPIAAAALFGLGGALKMYPVLFVVPLVLERLLANDKAGAAKTFGAGAGSLLAINVPFALANFNGWFATYEFHRLRGPNYDNIWTWPPQWFPAMTPDRINLITAVLTVVFFAGVLGYAWRRGRTEGRFPVVGACAAMLATFLLWNKVHSPQYALWILPFFVLLRTHIGWWIAYSLVDLAIYIGVFRFFYDQTSELYRKMMVGGVWLRAGLLLVLVVVFLRAESAPGPEPEPAGVREPRLNEPPAVATEVRVPV